MRISASSYSNTAPLIWSFLYGSNHGMAEIILDNAPARSAELLSQDRVDAALVPVFAYQSIDGVKLVPDVCVGARERVRSVRLISRVDDLREVRSVALDTSSRTSAALVKIIFREFIGVEPEWRPAEPDVTTMLETNDAALVIGDPALRISDFGFRISDLKSSETHALSHDTENPQSAIRDPKSYDMAELWRSFTGLGFVFAMWMTRRDTLAVDFAAARDEGLAHVDAIISNYESDIPLNRNSMREYLTRDISYTIDESMSAGLQKYFELAHKHQLIDRNKPLEFID
ncbi:MAG: menaquinone biosynthetic enzyme MqnA/MqnD family protein [Pyrinomonadaceae bacterium]